MPSARFYAGDPNAPTSNKGIRLGVNGTFSDPSRIIAYPDGNIFRNVTLAYLVDVTDPNDLRISDESRALRWLTPAQWQGLPIAETDREIVSRYPTEQFPILA